MPEPVYLDDGRIIGNIDGDTFIKTVCSWHILRQPPAWCMDAKVFDTVIKKKARFIIFYCRDTKERFWASVDLFDREKFQITRKHGRQYCLLLEKLEDRSIAKQLKLV